MNETYLEWQLFAASIAECNFEIG